jgi:tetraacyldisaccharide 4'-kinase
VREPAFWWNEPGLASCLLAPVAACYGAIANKRMTRHGARAGMPVICVGNFTLGGSGKTPTVIAISQILQNAGETVFCLSRGYGGSEAGPRRVDAHVDRAAQVGDEALLLARMAPTFISRNRATGAEAARAAGATVIVMDDGLQNGSIAKDFAIAVVDGRRGIGNGKVFPAGPLRASLDAQWERTDALLLVGDGTGTDQLVAAAKARGKAALRGRLVPEPGAITALAGKRVLAFAGIGDPEKFFATVSNAGIAIGKCQAFPDHHRFSAEEAAQLVMQAEHEGLTLLTTEKDHARMAHDAGLSALAERASVLPVTLELDNPNEMKTLLANAISRRSARGSAA